MERAHGHVLIVDDEEGLRDLFEVWLSDEYTVSTAASGAEALRVVDSSIDVVVLDWRLADLSGREVVEGIHERDLGARIVVVSGFDTGGEVETMADAALQKPVDREELSATIDELVGAE